MSNGPANLAGVHPAPQSGVKKIILAIHGIGDQSQNETIVSTAIQFSKFYKHPALIPLGAFHQVLKDGNAAFTFDPPPPCPGLTGEIGFAEIYWANIPRRVVRIGYALQETKAWAKTIVNRVRVLAQASNSNKADIDYDHVQLVLEEMITGIATVESLLFLAKKAGIFEF